MCRRVQVARYLEKRVVINCLKWFSNFLQKFLQLFYFLFVIYVCEETFAIFVYIYICLHFREHFLSFECLLLIQLSFRRCKGIFNIYCSYTFSFEYIYWQLYRRSKGKLTFVSNVWCKKICVLFHNETQSNVTIHSFIIYLYSIIWILRTIAIV